LYQGEELGLPEVDLRRDQLRDPVGDLYYPIAKGRDGCRTPMPWDNKKQNLGFSSGVPWLPLGPAHDALAVSRQEADKNSTLHFARSLLKLRKTRPALRLGALKMLDAPSPILAFIRSQDGERILCVFNMSGKAVAYHLEMPDQDAPWLASSGEVRRAGGGLNLGPYALVLVRL
jgi:alpha-glucosidase